MPCFVTRCKIFSMITHQTALREVRPNTAPLENLFLLVSCLYPGLILYVIRQSKDARRYHGSLFNLFFEEGNQN